jgi:hypothetical protein
MPPDPDQENQEPQEDFASSPWEWGVVVDNERDTIPVPAMASDEGEDDVVLERA